MDISNDNIPFKRAIFLVIVAVVIPIHIWSFLNILWNVPSQILNMRLWDIIGVAAYSQMFAMVESFIGVFLIIGLSLLLPRRFFRDHLVPMTAATVIITITWLVFFHFNPKLTSMNQLPILFLWLMTLLLALVLGNILVRRNVRVENALTVGIQKLSPLAVLYLVVDIFLILVILGRNLGGIF